MEKIKMMFSGKFLKIFGWILLILAGAYLILVVVRVFHFFNLDKTEAQVAKIHATKLSMSDVMGDNLPPDPGVEADKTIEGIDANENGIRDDVELAVFNEYPNSAKTRAVLLQYALVLQLEARQSNVNKEVATAIAEEESQAYDCIGKIVAVSSDDLEKIEAYRNFVEDKQINTVERKNLKTKFDDNAGSFELKSGCDIDLDLLQD
jgi:hypothetical protein